MSGEKNIAAEWQRLMKRWNAAGVAYDAARRSTSGRRDHGTTGSTDGALDQARRDLTEIKGQIDSMISACARTRVTSTEPLRLAFLDLPTDSSSKKSSPKDLTPAQALPRYSKR